MTTKKAATKVARILRSFGLSWGDSHKWGRKLVQTYDFCWDDTGVLHHAIIEALEHSDFPQCQWNELFERSCVEFGYSEAYQESYVTYEITVKRTGEIAAIFSYI